jgi:LPS export ABC transporter protein LptC
MVSLKKDLLRLAVLLILLNVFLVLVSCRNRIEDIQAISYRDTFPLESTRDVEMIFSDSAVIKAKMKSPLVNRYGGDNPYIIMPKGITVYFYDSAMNVRTKLTSLYAIKYEKSDKMEARNNVEVINHIGERLNTEHLVWDQKKRKIYTEVFVKITQPNRVVFGEGMDADESFDKWNLRKPKGSFYISTDDEKESEGSKP